MDIRERILIKKVKISETKFKCVKVSCLLLWYKSPDCIHNETTKERRMTENRIRDVDRFLFLIKLMILQKQRKIKARKRWMKDAKFIKNDTEAPNVCFCVVWSSLNDFWTKNSSLPSRFANPKSPILTFPIFVKKIFSSFISR